LTEVRVGQRRAGRTGEDEHRRRRQPVQVLAHVGHDQLGKVHVPHTGPRLGQPKRVTRIVVIELASDPHRPGQRRRCAAPLARRQRRRSALEGPRGTRRAQPARLPPDQHGHSSRRPDAYSPPIFPDQSQLTVARRQIHALHGTVAHPGARRPRTLPHGY
jgi:hypothetical protein